MSTAVRSKSKNSARRRLIAERRLVIRGAEWDDYLTLVDSLDEHSPLRVAFDGKDIEIMTKGMDHERFSFWLHHLIIAAALAQNVNIEPYGETTWRTPGIKMGLEADSWYFLDKAKRERIARLQRDAKKTKHGTTRVEDLPSPDLAIEIDISPPLVDRRGIYAALGVPELWQFDGERAEMLRLSREGRYEPVAESGWLQLSPAEIVRWLVEEDTTEFMPWLDRVNKLAKRRFAKESS
jgi:Uma2 family endonuclease